MKNPYQPADKPTMYFIGVTTTKSSINKIFPLWAERLELGTCQLKGIDFKLHDQPELYREAVEFIKGDPYSLGALVTTHKIDLCNACRDLFDALDPLSDSMEEVSSIFKRGGELHGRAVDPISSGLALEAFLPRDIGRPQVPKCTFWGRADRRSRCPGILSSRATARIGRPRSTWPIRNRPRLEHLQELHASWKSGVPLECHVVDAPGAADAILESLKPGSLDRQCDRIGQGRARISNHGGCRVSCEFAGLGIQLSW